MTSPLTHNGGTVNITGESEGGISLQVEFTSMTPILLEFYLTGGSLWLTFPPDGGAPGIINNTGVPWAGIEFRTARSVLAQDPSVRDDYFFFENSSQEWLDDVFFARTARDSNGVLYNSRYEAPYSADLTIGLYYDIPSAYDLY